VSQVSVNRLSKTRARLVCAALTLVVAVLPVAGCTEVETEASHGYEPSKLVPVKGKDDLARVIFTEEGAKRTGLRTGTVGVDGGRKVIPYAALIYDPEGKTYVYTSPKPRSYLREQVQVKEVNGDRAVLSDGPPAGTNVVTVGAAEVYGAELEIAASH